MMTTWDAVLSLSIPTFMIIHLLVTPFTKIEELFNIQATHDILTFGVPLSNVHERLSSQYDHFESPGPVPRTFVGPLLMASLTRPIVTVIGVQYAQLAMRCVLGLLNAAALLHFKANITRAFGTSAGRWYLVLQATQFHIMFYISRTLPNTFAFGLTTAAFGQMLPVHDQSSCTRRWGRAIALLTLATTIFRSEIAILLITTTLYGLAAYRISLRSVVTTFLVSFSVALTTTVVVDSFFWQTPIWPELWAFHFNAILGKSAEWGTSPWHYYFTAALPRIFANPVTFCLIAYSIWNTETSRQSRLLVLPGLAFIAVYSFLGHKEPRFIFYTIPPLTAAAALGASRVASPSPKRTRRLEWASLVIKASILISFAASCGKLLASSLNYPGGEALDELHKVIAMSSPTSATPPVEQRPIQVYTDALSRMTGVTPFGRYSSRLPWPVPDAERISLTGASLDGEEPDAGKMLSAGYWDRFDYVLAENRSAVLGGPWQTVGCVNGFAGFEVARSGLERPGSEALAPGRGDLTLGRGALVEAIRGRVTKLTGGWWAGPRLEPKIFILRRQQE